MWYFVFCNVHMGGVQDLTVCKKVLGSFNGWQFCVPAWWKSLRYHYECYCLIS